jgi:hypothetical protein
MSIPMGVAASVLQPITMLLFAPIVLVLLRFSIYIILFLSFIIAATLINVAYHEIYYSWFQLVRAIIPFIYFTAIVYWFDELANSFASFFRENTLWINHFEKVLYFFIGSQLIQTSLFLAHIDIANIASKSDDFTRIMLYPTTFGLVAILYFGLKSYYKAAIAIATLFLLTGSKALSFIALMMLLISIASKLNLKRAIALFVLVFTIIFAITKVDLLVFERATNFVSENSFEDTAREWEIMHAKESWNRNLFTNFFGNGLALSITPGFPVEDPGWAENSKFDIENGYFSVLAKLGILGSLGFIFILLRSKFSIYKFAFLFVILFMGFKTSYQIFSTFDGVVLALGSIILLGLHRAHINNEYRD